MKSMSAASLIGGERGSARPANTVASDPIRVVFAAERGIGVTRAARAARASGGVPRARAFPDLTKAV